MPSALPLKPSILDKLIADMGKVRADSSRERAPCFLPQLDRFNESELRACIQRDIAWILNDINFEAAVPLDDYPEVKTSVLNQGMPELTGRSLDKATLLRRAVEVTGAVRAFEERLRPDSIKVVFDKDIVGTDNKLTFAINGEIRNAVDESWIEFKSTVDLDDGHIEVGT